MTVRQTKSGSDQTAWGICTETQDPYDINTETTSYVKLHPF